MNYLQRSRETLWTHLVEPWIPGVIRTPGREFAFEGLIFGRAMGEESEWCVPKERLARQAALAHPLVFVHFRATAMDDGPPVIERVRIELVVGGEARLMHDGRWPLR